MVMVGLPFLTPFRVGHVLNISISPVWLIHIWFINMAMDGYGSYPKNGYPTAGREQDAQLDIRAEIDAAGVAWSLFSEATIPCVQLATGCTFLVHS